jgi:GAF domain-containing protein
MDELVALAGVVLANDDLPATLTEVCRIAVRSVPGAEGASITTFPEGRPSAISDDEWAKGFDELQYTEQEGPCLDAYRTGNTFRIRDLADEPRWPSYVPRAVERGARSMMSIPLAAQGQVVGALNFYGRSPDVFSAEAAAIGAVVASHAGLASQLAAAFFGHRQLAEQMAEAMQSRAMIEQAKGIIMATLHCDADTAFAELIRASQNSNRKLREVAQALVDSTMKGSGSG